MKKKNRKKHGIGTRPKNGYERRKTVECAEKKNCALLAFIFNRHIAVLLIIVGWLKMTSDRISQSRKK